MQQCGSDFTNTFRGLSRLQILENSVSSDSLADVRNYVLQQCATLDELQQIYAPHMDPQCVYTLCALH